MKNKLAIGTANFGMAYGHGTKTEKLSKEVSKEILAYAERLGIEALDTAISYGDCTKRLGSIGVKDWKIITKVPPIPSDITNVYEWVVDSVYKSSHEMEISIFEGVLIHNPKDILGKHAKELLRSLLDLKTRGLTRKIGVSIYEKKDLESIFKLFQPDIIQCPVNILDTRLLVDNYLFNLSEMGIEVHIRSIFLQGTLISSYETTPNGFEKFDDIWEDWRLWLNSNNLLPVEACIRFANSIKGVDKIIFGVNSISHLKEIFCHYNKSPIHEVPKWGSALKPGLIDPRLWNKR